ncbi:MAG: hydroxymethylglutaryl-CoA lyase [Acidobacteria bacterium]|nr:hydroxymethylglutaryl-CoA lyase [Acidobacteriota bacterium]
MTGDKDRHHSKGSAQPGIVLVETPRDAFQGIGRLIPTAEKIAHIEKLIAAGFRQIDIGSFVSPRAVPQMQDSEAVLQAITPGRNLFLIAIIANERGLERAAATGKINAVGFPFSISDSFQLQNTHRAIAQTWPIVEALVRRCEALQMDFILYLSMAFGNPYADPWTADRVVEFLRRLVEKGVRNFSLADTTSEADPGRIRQVVALCRKAFPDLQLGIHLHSDPAGWRAKLAAALEAGACRVDSAVGGMGGCPFAGKELVGNLPSEGVVELLESRGVATGIDQGRLQLCVESARRIMEQYGKTR